MVIKFARPRLGVDFHTFDGIFQGSRSHLLGLYREAIVQGPDVDFVFFLSRPDDLRRSHAEFSRSNVQLVVMPRRPGLWRLSWQLPALRRRHRLDLLHLQFRLPLLPSGPCICTLHDVLFETHPQYFGRTFRLMARLSARHAVRRARFTLTVSEYSRREIARHYPVDVNRVSSRRMRWIANAFTHASRARLRPRRRRFCGVGVWNRKATCARWADSSHARITRA